QHAGGAADPAGAGAGGGAAGAVEPERGPDLHAARPVRGRALGPGDQQRRGAAARRGARGAVPVGPGGARLSPDAALRLGARSAAAADAGHSAGGVLSDLRGRGAAGVLRPVAQPGLRQAGARAQLRELRGLQQRERQPAAGAGGVEPHLDRRGDGGGVGGGGGGGVWQPRHVAAGGGRAAGAGGGGAVRAEPQRRADRRRGGGGRDRRQTAAERATRGSADAGLRRLERGVVM